MHQVSADNKNTDTCPKKGYGIIHKLKKSSKFSFEKLEEKSNNEIATFNVKVPKLTNLKIAEENAENLGLTPENFSENGWTLVFYFNNPIKAEVTTDTFGLISTSKSGKLLSISSDSTNRGALSRTSKNNYKFRVLFRNENLEINDQDFSIKKVSLYLGEFYRAVMD